MRKLEEYEHVQWGRSIQQQRFLFLSVEGVSHAISVTVMLFLSV